MFSVSRAATRLDLGFQTHDTPSCNMNKLHNVYLIGSSLRLVRLLR